MEIFVVLEFLSDQSGADHLAVPLDQASLRLLRKDHARNRGHREWVGQARDQSQQDQDDDGGTNFSKHGVSPLFPSLRGAKRRSNLFAAPWIASLRSQ
jgi:hypothetical protein